MYLKVSQACDSPAYNYLSSPLSALLFSRLFSSVLSRLYQTIVFISTSFSLIEIDVLESFDLEDGENAIQDSSSCHSNNGYYFGKTTKDVVASSDVLNEFTKMLRQHRSFIVSFRMQPQPFHKGSLIWLEQKSKGKFDRIEKMKIRA